jgi:hypothetical protein
VTGDLVEGVWVGEAGVDRDLAAVLVGEAGEVGHALHEVLDLRVEVGAAVLPQVAEGVQDLVKRRTAVAGRRRK